MGSGGIEPGYIDSESIALSSKPLDAPKSYTYILNQLLSYQININYLKRSYRYHVSNILPGDLNIISLSNPSIRLKNIVA